MQEKERLSILEAGEIDLGQSLLDEGFAELEGNDKLYIYGNAFKNILENNNLQNSIRQVSYRFSHSSIS